MTSGRQAPTVLLASLLALAVACKAEPAPPKAPPAAPKTPETHAHDDAGGHKMIELGSGTVGPFSLRASRDEGPVKAGGDSPIDVWVTGAPKVSAVRFWIGTEDAKGSVKALAEIEKPEEPNRWHTHVEIPDPMPAGSRLWVEVEAEGKKSVASFDLKT
jgi:hypothetical protein